LKQLLNSTIFATSYGNAAAVLIGQVPFVKPPNLNQKMCKFLSVNKLHTWRIHVCQSDVAD